MSSKFETNQPYWRTSETSEYSNSDSMTRKRRFFLESSFNSTKRLTVIVVKEVTPVVIRKVGSEK